MDKLNERHCQLCEVEGREQIGGEWLVACKQLDCGAIHADETEASPHVALLEQRVEELEGVLLQISHMVDSGGNWEAVDAAVMHEMAESALAQQEKA